MAETTTALVLDAPEVIWMRGVLAEADKKIRPALPTHMVYEDFARGVLSAVRKQPGLAKCDLTEIHSALMLAATLGLDVSGGPTTSAYLIPYKPKVQLNPSPRGMIDLAMRSGKVKHVYAHCVYANDPCEITLGDEMKVKHSVAMRADRGEIIGAYAVVVFKDETIRVDWMSRKEIDVSRRKGAEGSMMWNEFYGEGAKKTVLKRLLKTVPISREMDEVMEQDVGDPAPVAIEGAKPTTIEGVLSAKPKPVEQPSVVVVEREHTDDIPFDGGQES